MCGARQVPPIYSTSREVHRTSRKVLGQCLGPHFSFTKSKKKRGHKTRRTNVIPINGKAISAKFGDFRQNFAFSKFELVVSFRFCSFHMDYTVIVIFRKLVISNKFKKKNGKSRETENHVKHPLFGVH